MDKFLTTTSTQLDEVHDVVDTTPNTTPKTISKLTPTPNTTTHVKPTRNSTIWDHFTRVKDENPKDTRCTCKCNYCGKYYACDSMRVGTSSLWVHLNNQCKGFKQVNI